LQIVFSGRLAIHLDRGAGSRKIVDWRGGDVCGLMPYSRGGSPPGDTVAEEPTETLAVHRDHLAMMIRECPSVTATLVHAMLDRARHFTSSDLHDEKLFSLGKLASGLAHELNNPASAASRSAKLLAKSQAKADETARALGAVPLSDPQRAAVDRLYAHCVSATHASNRTPMARADQEEAVSEWLTSHGLDDAIAPMLAGADATPASLETLAGVLTGDALEAALRWIAASCFVRELTIEIDTATSRIAELVAAIKSFTFMDRASTPESLDIRQGLTDTFTVLGAKTHAKSVAITLTFAPDLPRVLAFGGELNQVWVNVIDNALDAVAASGHVDVTATRELDRVVVRIVDDGPGIPVEIQGRIFDPFFTTKKVGEGTGLGLDIVRRLVKRHDGEIDVLSRPGRTEFRVSLPVETR
jgi:signal transduction histidine kinase